LSIVPAEFRTSEFFNCGDEPAHDIIEHGDMVFGRARAVQDEQICHTPRDCCPLAQIFLGDRILEFVDQGLWRRGMAAVATRRRILRMGRAWRCGTSMRHFLRLLRQGTYRN
jgi:hypothetical protein